MQFIGFAISPHTLIFARRCSSSSNGKSEWGYFIQSGWIGLTGLLRSFRTLRLKLRLNGCWPKGQHSRSHKLGNRPIFHNVELIAAIIPIFTLDTPIFIILNQFNKRDTITFYWSSTQTLRSQQNTSVYYCSQLIDERNKERYYKTKYQKIGKIVIIYSLYCVYETIKKDP